MSEYLDVFLPRNPLNTGVSLGGGCAFGQIREIPIFERDILCPEFIQSSSNSGCGWVIYMGFKEKLCYKKYNFLSKLLTLQKRIIGW